MSNQSSNTCICQIIGVEYLVNVPFHTISGIILAISAVLTISSNVIFLISMLKHAQNKSISEVLLMSLAFSDLLMGCFICPLTSYILLDAVSNHKMECALLAPGLTAGIMLLQMSVTSILLLALDLFLSVTYPYFYNRNVTKRRFLFVLMVLWLFGIVSTLTTLSSPSNIFIGVMANASSNLLCIMIILLMYMRTYFEISKIESRVTIHSHQDISVYASKRKMLKLSMSITIVFLSFLAPFGVCALYIFIVPKTSFFVSYYLTGAVVAVLLNPLCDPFVYYFRLAKVRRNVKRLLFSRNRIEQTEELRSSKNSKIQTE